jgi:hypothetical protein
MAGRRLCSTPYREGMETQQQHGKTVSIHLLTTKKSGKELT